MDFRQQLAQGTCGLRLPCIADDDFKCLEGDESSVMLRDELRSVLWLIRLGFAPCDLRLAFDDVLRRDCERHARVLFEERYRDRGGEDAAGERPPPRTADPTWSPLVDLERVKAGGAPALRAVHRLSYEPGDEVVVGRLQIPLAGGLCEINAIHRASQTGFRETALVLSHLSQALPDDLEATLEELSPSLPQSAFDDPVLDEKFPEHSLSRVRMALRWLLDPAGAGLEVTEPLPEAPQGEIELPEAESAIVPPPRYLRVSSDRLKLSPTLVMFARPLLEQPTNLLMDVFWLRNERVGDKDRAGELERLARHTLEKWADEGAVLDEIEVVPLPNEGAQARAFSYVRMRAGGEPTHCVARWIADRDGQVFRVQLGGPVWVPKDELVSDLEASASSWRRLAGAAPVQKKWWKLW